MCLETYINIIFNSISIYLLLILFLALKKAIEIVMEVIVYDIHVESKSLRGESKFEKCTLSVKLTLFSDPPSTHL